MHDVTMPKGTFCAYVPFGLLQIFKRKMHGNVPAMKSKRGAKI